MSDGNKIKVSASPCLTQQEMTDYISRKLSPEQRNRVERHLLECDLCVDAMEGLSMMANTDALDSLDELINKSISAETALRKGKLLSMRLNYRVAAALALLIIAGGVLYFILSDTGKNEKIFTQNFKPYKNNDTINTAGKPEAEETKALNGLASKAEEKTTAAKTANTDIVPSAKHKNAAKAWSEQKQDKEITTVMTKPVKDTSGGESKTLNNVTLSEQEVTTQTTVAQEQIKNASTRNVNSPDSTTAGIYQQNARGTGNVHAARSNATASYSKSKKQVSPESAQSKASYVVSPANAQKDSSFSIAMKAYNQKQYGAAVQLFDDYLKQYPDDEKATFYDAVSNLSIDSAVTALTQLEQVLGNENSVFHDDANWYKALALVKLHRNKEAKTLLKKIKNTNSPYSDEAAKTLDEF